MTNIPWTLADLEDREIKVKQVVEAIGIIHARIDKLDIHRGDRETLELLELTRDRLNKQIDEICNELSILPIKY